MNQANKIRVNKNSDPVLKTVKQNPPSMDFEQVFINGYCTTVILAGNNMFKVIIRNNRARSKMGSKLTIKIFLTLLTYLTPCSSVSIIFELVNAGWDTHCRAFIGSLEQAIAH